MSSEYSKKYVRPNAHKIPTRKFFEIMQKDYIYWWLNFYIEFTDKEIRIYNRMKWYCITFMIIFSPIFLIIGLFLDKPSKLHKTFYFIFKMYRQELYRLHLHDIIEYNSISYTYKERIIKFAKHFNKHELLI